MTADVRPELACVLNAETPAERAAATLDMLAADAAAVTAGTPSPITARQYVKAYGPRTDHYPGPWPEPVDQEPEPEHGHRAGAGAGRGWPFVD
jgi:hypothetical protein